MRHVLSTSLFISVIASSACKKDSDKKPEAPPATPSEIKLTPLLMDYIESKDITKASPGKSYGFVLDTDDSIPYAAGKFVCEGCPETLYLNDEHGIVKWIPDRTQLGLHEMTFTYANRYGSGTFKVSVDVQLLGTEEEKPKLTLAFVDRNVVVLGNASLESSDTAEPKCLQGANPVECPSSSTVVENDVRVTMINARQDDQATYMLIRHKALGVLKPYEYELYYMEEKAPESGVQIDFPRDLRSSAKVTRNLIVSCRGGERVELRADAASAGELTQNPAPKASLLEQEPYVAASYAFTPGDAGERSFTIACTKGSTEVLHTFTYTVE